MQQHSLSRTIARLTFYGVALVLFAWTASLTYSFVATALPTLPWYVPLLSLIVFDAGLIAWLFVFLHHAEGGLQRAVALLACALDLVGVGLMVIAEILLGGQTWAAAPEALGEWAIWGIGLWTVANVVAVVLFHLGSPQARRQMAIQSQKDAVLEAALQNLNSRRVADGGRLAETMARSMYSELVAELQGEDDQQPASPPLSSPVRRNGHVEEDEGADRSPPNEVALEVADGDRPRPR